MTCPLCGVKEHDGPCYKEWRERWRNEDYKHKLIVEVAEFNLNRWEQFQKEAECLYTFAGSKPHRLNYGNAGGGELVCISCGAREGWHDQEKDSAPEKEKVRR